MPDSLRIATFTATLLLISLSQSTFAQDAQTEQIVVHPAKAELVGNLARLQLVVESSDSTGRPTDVTRRATYRSLSPELISVSPEGQVIPLANGQTKVRVTLGQAAVDVEITIRDQQPEAKVSFRQDVVPVLSKAGCNQGACHATQFGQGDLKLSLFGYAPEQDHSPLTRDLKQRRVSLLRPEDSLILRKATMQIAHGGGRRFRQDSYEYEVLKSWIAAGCAKPDSKDATVVDLSVLPTNRVYRVDETQQMRVVAHYSDGTTRDVTHRAKYDSLGDAVARVDEFGFITAVGHGQAAVMVRYEGQAKISDVLSPFTENIDLANFNPNNYIDEKVKQHWQRLGVQPAGLCSDSEFIRRAFLDSIGTLPKPEKVNAFLESNDPNKRVELVDELLGLTGDSKRDIYTNEWSAYWALKWGDLLRNNDNTLGNGGMWSLANWIRQSLR